MNIPASLKYRVIAYGDGAKGKAFQIARNEEFGIQVNAMREQRGTPFVETWTSDYLPDQEFPSLNKLRDAVVGIEPTVFKPEIVSVSTKSPQSSGRCWVCRGEWVHTVRVKTGWRPGDVSLIPACDRDLERVKAEPLAAIAARHAAVLNNGTPHV